MGVVMYQGQPVNVPDDATDEEVLEFLDTPGNDPMVDPESAVMRPDDPGLTLPPLEQQEYQVPLGDTEYDESESFGGTQRRAGGPTPGESLTNPNNAGAAYETARGVFNELGTMTGLPIEAYTAFGRLGGFSDMQPGEGLAYFKRFLHDHGFPQGSVDTLAGKFGEDLAWNVIFTGATSIAGKQMLKKFLDPVTGKLIPEEKLALGKGALEKYLGMPSNYKIGRALGANPGEQQLAAVAGSVTQAATEDAQGESPATALIGYMPGAVLGSYSGRRLKGIYDYATRDRVKGSIVQPIDSRLGVPAIDVLAPKVAAEDRVARDLAYIDTLTEQATEGTKAAHWQGVRPWKTDKAGNPISRLSDAQSQAKFEAERDWAETTMRQIERQYWDNATAGKPVEATGIQTKVAAFGEDLFQNATSETTPAKFLKEIENWPPSVKTEKIWATISDIFAERKRIYKHNSDFAGDKSRYSANLDRLEGILREALESAVDNPKALAQARYMTSARKQRFVDGPMGEARFMEGKGSSVSTNPLTGRVETIDFRRENSAPLITRTEGGPLQVQRTQQMFDKLGIKTSISEDFENAVRTQYLEETAKFDPNTGQMMPDVAKADAWLKKHESTLKPYKKLLSDLEQHIVTIRANMDERKAINTSVYAKVANATEGSMQTQINNAFFHPDAKDRVLQLSRTFTKDAKGANLPANHDNVQAWESLVVQTLLKRGGNNAKGIQQLIATPEWKDLLKIAFHRNPEKLQRLYHAVDLGVNLERDGVRGDLTGLARNQAVFWAGIFGAKLGTGINSGSIQIPGFFARSGRNIVSNFMNRVLPQPPGEKLYWAIHTPEGYNWLTKNVYEGAPGLRKAVRDGRRLNAVLNTQSHERLRQWMDENGVRPR